MTPVQYLVAGLVIGAIVGGILGWLLGSKRAPALATDDRLADELKHQLGQRESELTILREQLSQSAQARVSAEATRSAAESLVAGQRELHERHLAEARQSQEKALTDLRETFKALSADALRQTAPEFLRLANETLAKFQESAKGDLAQRQQAIATLVEPLKQQLESYQHRLQQGESA